ncbi:MAG: hypothetical protein RRY96_04145, partial [Ruthenibacterium sp.]
PPAVIYRAGYEWSFFTTMERQAPTLAQEDLPITPYDMQPDAAIKISFSKTPSTLRVWRANGRYSTDFTELASEDKSTFTTPHDAGVYLYKVKAEWGRRGFIQYYFAVDVKKQYTSDFSILKAAAYGICRGFSYQKKVFDKRSD